MHTVRAEPREPDRISITDFSVELKVLNNTGRGVYLYGREGYVAYIEPTYCPDLSAGIYFNTEVKSTGRVKTDASSFLVEKDSESRPSGRLPRRKILEGFTFIRSEILEMSSTELHYVTDHDVAIGFREPTVDDVHPFSRDGVIDYVTNGARKKQSSGGLDVTIDIIDNESTYGDRYISIGGSAFIIKARKDPMLESGIYAGWTNEIRINGSAVAFGKRLFRFDELESSVFPFTLFKTPEEAVGFDPAKKFEMDINASKNRLEALKQEREEMSLFRKDYYEARALGRKDSSDGWKLIPAVVLGLVTLVKLFT